MIKEILKTQAEAEVKDVAEADGKAKAEESITVKTVVAKKRVKIKTTKKGVKANKEVEEVTKRAKASRTKLKVIKKTGHM